VNIWLSYKEEDGCLVHFMRLATAMLEDEEFILQTSSVRRETAVVTVVSPLLRYLDNQQTSVHRFLHTNLTPL